MHFSIPDTQEIKDEIGSTYQVFNIHINGVHHCSLRYSQLRDLNDQLRGEFPSAELSDFPPKKMFSLKGDGLNERRFSLEKYIQSVGQCQDIWTSGMFGEFLHKAQQETRREETIPVSLDVYLMNGAKNAAACIGIPEDYVYYFGLFLMKKEESGKLAIVRKLQVFESPFISVKALLERRLHKIVIRKAYWDQEFDDDLTSDVTTFNLLHVQAVSDVKAGWTVCTKDTQQRISSLQSRGSKRECLKLCRTLRHYGFIQFKPCVCDFPTENSKVTISVGNYEIHFSVEMGDSHIKDATFSVTRIRCWRASSQFNNNSDENQNMVERERPLLQLSFEYLVSKGNMKWISIISDQAIMMSMSLKDMVDELLRKRKGGKIRKPEKSRSNIRFKPRDKSSEALFGPEINESKDSSKMPMNHPSDSSLLENIIEKEVTSTTPTAFEGIGDDDL